MADCEAGFAEKLVEECDPTIKFSHKIPWLGKIEHDDNKHALKEDWVAHKDLKNLLVLVVIYKEKFELGVCSCFKTKITVVRVLQVNHIQIGVVDDRGQILIAESSTLSYS